ncbi:histidine phosphatase family protein, partial [Dyella silvatica]|uniref:histidine phosphatase family protein n=1 Tax=Dyella silvatica TaxID=2992128 RepID=UPI002253B135
MSTVYLIRHGQAAFGEADYDRLSERGTQQAQLLGAALAPALTHAQLIVCGDMQRHRQTAQACLEAIGLATEWEVDAQWNEFDHDRIVRAYRPEYADHARLRADLLASPDPQRMFQTIFEAAVLRWVSGQHDADYSETWLAFRARCRQALHSLLARLPPATDALVFTSGGPIAAITQDLLQIPDSHGFRLNWVLVNGGVTKLIVGKRGAHLST